jgi:hypothetical protein
MCVCMYVCTYVCMYVCMHICIMYVLVCIYVCMYVRTYAGLYVCMSVCMYYVCWFVSMYVCIYVCIVADYFLESQICFTIKSHKNINKHSCGMQICLWTTDLFVEWIIKHLKIFAIKLCNDIFSARNILSISKEDLKIMICVAR